MDQITFTVYIIYPGNELVVSQAGIKMDEVLWVGKIYGFKKKRIEKLMTHPSPKYYRIWLKDYELHRHVPKDMKKVKKPPPPPAPPDPNALIEKHFPEWEFRYKMPIY